MPAGPRKSAAAKPDPEASDGEAAAGPKQAPAADQDRPADPDVPGGAVPTGGGASATANAPARPAKNGTPDAVPEPTFHWETTAGAPGDPCRICHPAGPPPGAGAVGCPHGQWVRVPDKAP